MHMESHEDKIRERAYAIWEREGSPEGMQDWHWEQAEAEIRAEEDAPMDRNDVNQSDPMTDAAGAVGEEAAPARGTRSKRQNAG